MICEIENGVTTYRVETPEELAAMQMTEETVEEKQKRYEELVVSFISERYSVSNELAILRQRDTKPNEFAEYNAYCEECKARAKE